MNEETQLKLRSEVENRLIGQRVEEIRQAAAGCFDYKQLMEIFKDRIKNSTLFKLQVEAEMYRYYSELQLKKLKYELNGRLAVMYNETRYCLTREQVDKRFETILGSGQTFQDLVARELKLKELSNE